MDNTINQEADFFRLVAWLHANRQRLITVGVVVLVVGVVVGGYLWHKNYHEAAASEALSEVKPPQSSEEDTPTAAAEAQPFLKVAEDYPGTRAGERALIIGAGILFDAGEYDQAHDTFVRFTQDYPDSPMANEALLGVGSSLEAQGKIADAAATYDDLIKRHQADATTPQAKSALARVDVALGKPELALHLYDELMKANGNDSWSSEAGIQFQELLAKYPNLRKLTAAPAAPTASSTVTVPGLN